MIEHVASSSERPTTVCPRSANAFRSILIWKIFFTILILVFAASAARENDIVTAALRFPWCQRRFR